MAEGELEWQGGSEAVADGADDPDGASGAGGPGPEALDRLGEEARRVAWTMALVGCGRDAQRWAEHLWYLQLGKADDPAFSPDRIAGHLRDLVGMGLAVEDRPPGPRIAPPDLRAVLVDWRERDRAGLARAVRVQRDWHSFSFLGNMTMKPAIAEPERLSRTSVLLACNLLEDWEQFDEFLWECRDLEPGINIVTPCLEFFDLENVDHLSDRVADRILLEHHVQCVHCLDDPEPLLAYARSRDHPALLLWEAELEMLRGDFGRALEIASILREDGDQQARADSWILEGWLHAIAGEDPAAARCFDAATGILLEGTRKKKCHPGGLGTPFLLLSRMRRGLGKDAATIKNHIRWGTELDEGSGYFCFKELGSILRMRTLGERSRVENICASHWDTVRKTDWGGVCDLITLWGVRCFHPALIEEGEAGGEAIDLLETFALRARAGGYHWVEMEWWSLIAAIASGERAERAEGEADRLRESFSPPVAGLIDALSPVTSWEESVKQLETLAQAGGKRRGGARSLRMGEKRLLWGVRYDGDSGFGSLTPYEQKVLVSLHWGCPRKINLDRLMHTHREMDFLRPEDHEIARLISRDGEWGHHFQEPDLPFHQALPHLVGHPHAYREDLRGGPDLSASVRVVEIEAAARLEEDRGGGVRLHLVPDAREAEEGQIVVRKPDPGSAEIQFYRIGQSFAQLARAFPSERSRRIPAEAKERVSRALARLSGSGFAVQGDESALAAAGTGALAADPGLHLRLEPAGEGLRATVLVQPLGHAENAEEGSETAKGGGTFPPGKGPESLLVAEKGETRRLRRDLAEEERRLSHLVQHCPALGGERSGTGLSWIFPTLPESLELLLQLREMPDHLRPAVEWPEGEALRLKGQAKSTSVSLRLKSSADWLEADGEVEIDEDTVLGLQTLLKELQRQGGGRFVRLDDGQYLALTDQLRQQLGDLAALSGSGRAGQAEDGGGTGGEEDRDGPFRLPPLAAHLVEDLAGEADTEADDEWKKRIDRLEEARDLPVEIPGDLRAELRPYQREGYEWMARLAHWSGGACLADDMGLGKTVQSLALLLRRAGEGPALVVAPTSVAANWVDEAEKFAPSLSVKVYRGPGRERLLDEAGPGDLVVATYGLLQQDSEAFAGPRWSTVVVDEAQAIKNRKTLRYKAVLGLCAGFRLITTGTPVENHLQELHNLFQFIQPGLLGGLGSFRRTFAAPIERDGNPDARDRLRRLIQPFILRRVKSDVLRDLPEKTEITLGVEMSREEKALYEALRRNAIEAVAENRDQKGAIHILAELTRLRRACCHPALVVEDRPPASSKLARFSETLDEILQGGHKVLVFSQFVDHLSLVREHLAGKQIAHQYLDGATTPKQRKERIDAFQSGGGDVFLISLKAGGFGLNLTAADYVIHLDPWWNPAVEDQASDRAHRIGQTRPVTIYRLVTRGTIEEKIVELHREKRELADSLLAGTDSALRLDAEELRELLVS